ncbi:putative protein OS=Tsukamurella paurometabola (strain ATCC 8368 / DSM / CCUG 35730 /CIP 100753 / JCM 10117 / KCTC 9821 / NBRC 16120 / NCIMB 702349/ NCTC 13040) OX=521096 GN=Tpau_0320 PE=4 SV=1 [Tsukamurella paurometabola]|uniref:Uncharacterized protein n=1 Tax=Tsukamurella paurometabola (strain ATCC 8368 / DSM 20162 / CCUG 35730 / CIP 100753 / JCM 10117 / KCTC 9821 / NBRC 16120 / NCIMB 702349 / NCTC 13040) TaxID=521096 RepID=D5URB2_TSUPD|nr:hypothetical protein Tpau_0320 [Tsukamurella paurometabola DSM 20162]SUP42334.1 Uncharacterised protein [Tsukamurella paurometabola]
MFQTMEAPSLNRSVVADASEVLDAIDFDLQSGVVYEFTANSQRYWTTACLMASQASVDIASGAAAEAAEAAFL